MGLMKQGAMMTVLSTLITALAWPATLIAATDFIDSKWSIAIDRYSSRFWMMLHAVITCLNLNTIQNIEETEFDFIIFFCCVLFTLYGQIVCNPPSQLTHLGLF